MRNGFLIIVSLSFCLITNVSFLFLTFLEGNEGKSAETELSRLVDLPYGNPRALLKSVERVLASTYSLEYKLLVVGLAAEHCPDGDARTTLKLLLSDLKDPHSGMASAWLQLESGNDTRALYRCRQIVANPCNHDVREPALALTLWLSKAGRYNDVIEFVTQARNDPRIFSPELLAMEVLSLTRLTDLQVALDAARELEDRYSHVPWISDFRFLVSVLEATTLNSGGQ